MGLEVRLLPTPHGRQTLSSITSVPRAGQLVQEPPAPSVSVCMRVWTRTCTGWGREAGTFHCERRLNSCECSWSFQYECETFLLAYVIKNKKAVTYRRPRPAFYFCEQQCVSPAKAQPREGTQRRGVSRLPPAEEQGSRSASSLQPEPNCRLGPRA